MGFTALYEGLILEIAYQKYTTNMRQMGFAENMLSRDAWYFSLFSNMAVYFAMAEKAAQNPMLAISDPSIIDTMMTSRRTIFHLFSQMPWEVREGTPESMQDSVDNDETPEYLH